MLLVSCKAWHVCHIAGDNWDALFRDLSAMHSESRLGLFTTFLSCGEGFESRSVNKTQAKYTYDTSNNSVYIVFER